MKFSKHMAIAAVSFAILGAAGARADTILQYTFDPGTYYDFSGGDNDSVTGTFSFDSTNNTLSNVDYHRGTDIFTAGVVGGVKELYFGDTSSGDYDVYEFQSSLALGGTDVITNGYHPAIPVDVGGSVSSTSMMSAVPEPATWAMMLMGFGMVGYAMRGRKFDAAAKLTR